MGSELFFIEGRPATFATKGEVPWKESMATQIPRPSLKGSEKGIVLDFRLPSLAPMGHPLDVDNLCEPVFSVLINKVGWFGGARPNLTWWEATKTLGKTAGCHLKIVACNRPPLLDIPPMWDEVYQGPLPEHAKSVDLAQWAWRHRRRMNCLVIPESCTIYLGFGSNRVNLGGISAGGIKAFIDCLYPLIGAEIQIIDPTQHGWWDDVGVPHERAIATKRVSDLAVDGWAVSENLIGTCAFPTCMLRQHYFFPSGGGTYAPFLFTQSSAMS